MGHPVTLIRGNGIGLEVASAAQMAIEATGVAIDWTVVDAGIGADGDDASLLGHVLNAIRQTKTALMGPTMTSEETDLTVNRTICQQFNLYAHLQPVKSIPGVDSHFCDLDLVIVRENTEDLYAGIEFERTTSEAADARSFLAKLAQTPIRDDAAIAIKPISVLGSRQIVEFAFQYARAYGRRKVTAVHQANRMKYTDGLFLEVACEVAQSYRDIEFEDQSVDHLCTQLMQTPNQYDVLVMPNLYGDIFSYLCTGMLGDQSVSLGASIGDDYAIFGSIDGCAPKDTKHNQANPTALILSSVLMLQHLGERDAAQRLQVAVQKVIVDQEQVTYDFASEGTEPVSPYEIAEAVVNAIA